MLTNKPISNDKNFMFLYYGMTVNKSKNRLTESTVNLFAFNQQVELVSKNICRHYKPLSTPACDAHVQLKTAALAGEDPPAVTPAGTSPFT